MALEPTRACAATHDAWDYELPMHAALREKASRRGAVGASGASVPGRVAALEQPRCSATPGAQ